MSFKGLEHDGFDWNVHHKLYRGDMVRRAVGLLDDVRLTRPDDACLSFAIALQARSYRAIPDSCWYVYNLGRGVTLGSDLSISTFRDIAAQDAAACRCVESLIDKSGYRWSSVSRSAYADMRQRLLEHTMNEWWDNLDADDMQEDCLRLESFGMTHLLRARSCVSWAAVSVEAGICVNGLRAPRSFFEHASA